jgi:radical SAM superfamily enzyme YgiQ (UPF0313 family)
VAAEVASIPGSFFLFVDDNLTADPDYARALFAQLRPLKKRWVTQTTLGLAEQPDLLAQASAAGCVGVFVGLESFSARNLGVVGKSFHRVERYREAIRQFHCYGIAVEAGIVFGFPGDTETCFRRTLETLDRLEVDLVQVSIFTPLPGTARFASMQDRIRDRNWEHYDFHHVVFEPEGLPARSLQAGHDWVTRQFYRPDRIARRLVRQLRRPRGWVAWPYLAVVNLAYLGRVRQWGIRGWDPSAGGEVERAPLAVGSSTPAPSAA